MREVELLDRLGRLRTARIGGVRAPHKPLLLLWSFGRFAATGSSLVSYEEAEEPVSDLINEFGPPVSSPGSARQRAAMPFVHLERELWELTSARDGSPIRSDIDESGRALRALRAVGRLRPEVERVLAIPGGLAAAVRLLLDRHFTPALAELICTAAGLDLPALEEIPGARPARRLRRAGFAEEVLRAYAYSCAMCGFDGRLARSPVGIQAAHVRWHSQEGPDEIANAVALCALHHVLFDLGVLGLTPELRVRVSEMYVARSEARAVHGLAGRRLDAPQPGRPAVDIGYVRWHAEQVFKGHRPAA